MEKGKEAQNRTAVSTYRVVVLYLERWMVRERVHEPHLNEIAGKICCTRLTRRLLNVQGDYAVSVVIVTPPSPSKGLSI
jgi:hypothetical protein